MSHSGIKSVVQYLAKAAEAAKGLDARSQNLCFALNIASSEAGRVAKAMRKTPAAEKPAKKAAQKPREDGQEAREGCPCHDGHEAAQKPGPWPEPPQDRGNQRRRGSLIVSSMSRSQALIRFAFMPQAPAFPSPCAGGQAARAKSGGPERRWRAPPSPRSGTCPLRGQPSWKRSRPQHAHICRRKTGRCRL